ncbi:MAG: type II and III secretion system family protein [Pseudomonadota bacterium]
MRRQTLTRQLVYSTLIASVLTMPMTACDMTQNYGKMDRSSNAQFQDYRNALSPREVPPAAAPTNIPPLEPYVAAVPDTLKPMPLVSVSVNQSIPLRDVLYELAKQADYDIELDPQINGSVIFTARNRPFDQVIDRISELAGLRYRFTNDVLRVELDTPYNVNYKVDYLTSIRSNTSGLQTSVSVVTGEGANTGSNFSISSQSENNFWGELDTSLRAILQSNASQTQLRTTQDPQLNVSTAQNVSGARNEPPPPPAAAGATDAASGGTAAATAPADTAAPAPAPVLQVAEVAAPAAASAETGVNAARTPSFSMNRSSGIVTVFASQQVQREIESYLNELRRQMASQVLIEAKVLEVSLSDSYALGIDWSELSLFNGRIKANVGFPGRGLEGIPGIGSAGGNGVTLTLDQGGTTALVDAISQFGTVRALASPRLTVLNNQPAVLNVARNEVYFEISVEETTEDDTGDRRIRPEAEVRSVPIGVLINVLPVIDLDKQTVTMQVRPTISRIEDRVADPTVAFLAADSDIDLENLVPVVGVQEIDSVVKMGSGQTLVMGGLLQDRTESDRRGVPVLGELPGIGAAFRNQRDEIKKSELVILLKATILNETNGVTPADRDLYRGFGQDRRPTNL